MPSNPSWPLSTSVMRKQMECILNLIVFAICWGIHLCTSHFFIGGYLRGQL